MKIKLLSIGKNSINLDECENLLAYSNSNIKIVGTEKIDAINLGDIKMDFIGYKPSDITNIILKELKLNKEKKDVCNFIICNYRMSSNFSWYYAKESNIVLLTLKNLKAKRYRDLTALIYSIYLTLFSKLKIENIHLKNCFFNLKYDAKDVSRTICEQCSENIGHNKITNVRHVIDGIFEPKYEEGLSHVILIHGIRTYGEWQLNVQKILEDYKIPSTAIFYDYFPTIKLLLNRFFGYSIQTKIEKQYHYIKSKHPEKKISIIAHSFGTLLVTQLLLKKDDISFDKIILVGSIVNRNFSWQKMMEDNRVNRVLNECADGDIFPILAKKYIPLAGASGSSYFGPNNDNVINERHSNQTHSSLLKDTNIQEKRWIPFLINNSHTIEKKTVEPKFIVRTLDRILPTYTVWFLIIFLLLYFDN